MPKRNLKIADIDIVQVEVPRNECLLIGSWKLQWIKQTQVDIFGHVLTENRIQPAKEKLEVIRNMKTASNTKELQTILGMVTYLNSFSTKLADLTSPLRKLTKKHVHHQQALNEIKKELCSSKLISYYDPDSITPTVLQCDARQTGIEAWLRQLDSQGNEHLVALASWFLTKAESRYSNMEHECLTVTCGSGKFEYYLPGLSMTGETDHSPLEQIFKKNINEAPSRLQRLLQRYLRFDVHVQYKQGRSIPVADALSQVCHRKAGHNPSARQRRTVHWKVLSSMTSLPTESKNYGSFGNF